MFEFVVGSCYPDALVGVYVGLLSVDGLLAVIAFTQLLRIHSRNSRIGWTRQKVFHLMIGSSNAGCFVYIVLTLVAACKDWACWSDSCGFITMACPQIIFLAAFLLLLSFWVDLCHQSNDEDDEDDGYNPREALLEKMNKENAAVHSGRKCCSFRAVHVGSHQKIVILVYVDLFAVAVFSLGGALACYGLVLFLKMSKVRSERVASEKWKVAGLAIVSVVCFTSYALVALFTNIPLLYNWNQETIRGIYTSVLLVFYYFLGSSIPSAFLLWMMRELPAPLVINREQESRTIAFISDSSVTVHPQRWTTTASLQNQVSRASPI
ncbi:tobamovirus multiplication protein 1 isoform X2 [Coffea arabica]|uniref:Tobamovirus multiplication protein 1 isoform X2 n=1 Tax=Coffea arabica TaxID=13443 RepID=A0ABM4VNH2_COFAR